TYLIAGRKLAAPLLLAACLGYLQHAHQLITDNALVAGVAIGLYGLSRRSGLLLGTGAGIAFLSKGLLGPGVLALTAIALLALREWRASWRIWPWALLAFAPWALIWPWLLHRHSPALFDEWFWVNNFGRFTGEAGLGGGLEVLPRWLEKPLDAIAVWGAGIGGVALWAAWIAFVDGWRPAFLEAQAPGFVPHLQLSALIAALAVSALWFYALRLQPRLPVRWLAGVMLVWGLAMTLWLPWLDFAKSYRGVIADMQRARPTGACVTARNLTEPQT